MRMRPDGSVQSSNTPTWQNVGLKDDSRAYRCMVTKVIYVDDPANITKNSQNPETMYEVVILGGFATGQILSNVRTATGFGGNDNFSDRTLTASSKKLSETGLSQHDGDIVYVQFNQGHQGYPVITSCGQGISDSSSGTKAADGPRFIEQYNGVLEETNNKGEYSLKRKGGSVVEGRFVPNADFDSEILLEENQKVTVKTKSGTNITIDGNGKSITIQDGQAGEVKIAQGKIAIGTSAVELLQQISDELQKISQFMINVDALHDHIGNLGYPSSVPETTTDFIQLGTDLAAIKVKVESIKGTI